MRLVSQLRIKKTQLAIMLGTSLMFVTMQNCSNVGFSHSDSSTGGTNGVQSTTTTPNSCNNNQLLQITTPVKILFVVDQSGSNAGDQTHPGTDPDKAMRGGSIQKFFNDFGGKSNFNWGFITFQGSWATALLNNGSANDPSFTSNSAPVQSAINYFNSSTDVGMTPYKAAIAMAHAAIANDTADTPETKYIIVFLSDGLPTDYADGSAGDSAIASDVSALVGIKPGRISFNTVYYGPYDTTASGRLHMMANTGSGQFLDTNANPAAKDFLINNVATVPGTACQ